MRALKHVLAESEVDIDYKGPEIRKLIYGRRFLGAIKILKI